MTQGITQAASLYTSLHLTTPHQLQEAPRAQTPAWATFSDTENDHLDDRVPFWKQAPSPSPALIILPHLTFTLTSLSLSPSLSLSLSLSLPRSHAPTLILP